MFGYITPVKDELTATEFEVFKSYYCGLCSTIKKNYGNIPCLGLSYDSTFFAVLLDGISVDEPNSINKLCLKHPLHKKTMILSNNALNYAADINIALIYFKIIDDVQDECSLKSISLYKLIKPFYKKINNNTLKSIFEVNLNNFYELESKNVIESIDAIAEPFAKLIGEILMNIPFTINNDCDKTRQSLFTFGYNFGKLIYLMDALDDLKNDMDTFKFNPIFKIYGNEELSYEKLIIEIKENLDFTLITLASTCSNILSQLPIKRNDKIIKNVVNYGLTEKYMNIFANL